MKINDNNIIVNTANVSTQKPAQSSKKSEAASKDSSPKADLKDQVDISSNSTRYGFTEGNYVLPLETGGGKNEVLPKLVDMVSGAKEAVQVQIYRLGHNKIVDVLAEQARKGVKVQVLMDPTPGYNEKDAAKQTEMQNYLRSAGVEILKYPIDGPSGKIDHVKMLIVDGKSLLIGGMNFDQHSPLNKDYKVFVEGPAVGDAQDVFNNDWKISGGETIPGLKPLGPQEKGDAKVRMLTTEVDAKDINTALQENIKGAKKSIKIEAFAIAHHETIDNLIEASQRGVDVKVMLDPNVPISFVNRRTADRLREGGVEVRWRRVDLGQREKLHAKLAMFDDDKAILGSCNFTKAGLEINHEANVEVISKSVGTAFNNMFDHNWENYGVESIPYVPDFYETVDNAPKQEQMGKEIYRYFTEAFNPGVKRIWTGKRKAAILQAIEKYDKTDKPGPIKDVLGNVGNLDEAKEMEVIGDLASFAGQVKGFKMDPEPGSFDLIYDRRVEIADRAAKEVHKNVPRYLNDMSEAIQDKKLRDFVKNALENVPEGFLMAPGASTGKWHPADENNPADVNMTPDEPYGDYKGGGLVLHSRRVQVMADKLCDHYGVKGKRKDEVLAAAALHDVMKGVTMEQLKDSLDKGEPIYWSNRTTPEHGHVAAEWIKNIDPTGGKMTENVQKLVSGHMSIWNKPEPSIPETLDEFIVSMADYIVSQRHFYLEV